MRLLAKSTGGASPGSRTAAGAGPAALPLASLAAEAAWLALLLAAPLVMNRVAPRVFEAAKLTALLPLAALLVAACLAAAWNRVRAGGGSQGLQTPGLPSPGNAWQVAAPARMLVFAYGALLASALLATLASETPSIALIGSYGRREGLAAWLIAALPGAAMLALLRDGGQARRVLDALLLACVLPCVYALLQSHGLVAAGAVLAMPEPRPGGTLGNPVFLGDYLLLLAPLTLARLLTAASAWRARLPWIVLLALQGWVLLLTQSRAPIAALLVALWLFAFLLAGLRRSRALLLGASAVLAGALLAMAAINLVPAAGAWAQEVPGLRRLVLGSTDLSGVSRLGTWQAGWDTLRHAPWLRQVIGFGFDAAYWHYPAYLPASVLAIEGQFDLADRLHNEVLELLAGIGALGLAACLLWLSLLLHGVRKALVARRGVKAGGRGVIWAFVLLPWAFGLCAAGIALALTGRGAMAGPAFGLGAGLAWALLLAMPMLRSRHLPARPVDAGVVMVTALAATLLAFWFDAQLSLPVMSTRMVFFTLAALLALLAGAAGKGEAEEALPVPARADAAARERVTPGLVAQVSVEEGSATGVDGASAREARWLGWMAGVLLAVGAVAFCPVPFDADPAIRVLPLGWTLALALAAPLVAAITLHWAAGGSLGWGGAGRALAAGAVLCALPAWGGYLLAAPVLARLWPDAPELALGGPALWVWIWLPVSGLAMAWWQAGGRGALPGQVQAVQAARARRKGQADKGNGARSTGPVAVLRLAALLLTLALPVTVALAASWTELRADMLARLARRAWEQGDFGLAFGRAAHAAALRPGERQYRITLGAWRLERVLAQLRQARGAPAAQFMFLVDEMRAAEADQRAALALAPDDPWAIFALANVLQFKAMTATRPLFGEEEGMASQREARQLFARAQERFPAQPTILRNWAQLEFDGGDAQAAYRLLDRMELLAPDSDEPYLERWRMARHAGDAALADATLARARARLSEARFRYLEQALAAGG